MYKREKVAKETFKLLLSYMEGLAGAARDRAKDIASEIVQRDGAYTDVEEELMREDREKKTASNTERNSSAATKGADGGESIASLEDPKEAERTKAFRILRAKKVLLALADNSSSDDEDGESN